MNQHLFKTIVSAVLLAAGLGCSSGAAAAAWCQPVRVDASKGQFVEPKVDAARVQRVFVEQDTIDSGLYLLGLDGSRVEVGQSLLPDPKPLAGRMQVPALWATRVDWSVYQLASLALQPTPVLVFEVDDQGRRHLCRIEERELTQAYQERVLANMTSEQERDIQRSRRGAALPASLPAPLATDLRTKRIEQLIYDAEQRPTGFEALTRDEESGRWQGDEAVCVTYDPAGSLVSFARPQSGTCSAVKPEDVSARYMHGVDGRLLRSVEGDVRMEQQGGQYALVSHPSVLVYDDAGAVRARYQEDAQHQIYRLPEATLLRDRRLGDVKVVGSPAGLDGLYWPDPRFGKTTPWVVVAMPADTANESDFLLSDPLPLARGKVGKTGKIYLAPAERQRVWDAMHHDGQLIVLHAYDSVVLAPRVPASQWKACLDQSNQSREGCP